jgi:DNA-binding transcriptional ArsR family regulator
MPTGTSVSGGDDERPADHTAESRIASALAHPLRARILQRLGERVASPADLAA